MKIVEVYKHHNKCNGGDVYHVEILCLYSIP